MLKRQVWDKPVELSTSKGQEVQDETLFEEVLNKLNQDPDWTN